ncbi:MAG: TatD family hydrolase [Crocinitomicaceae bacterium]
MFLVDTHTHLFVEQFNEDREEVVQRAIDAGVEVMLLPNIDLESIPQMNELAAKYPKYCFPMMGLHPGSVDQNWQETLQTIEKELFTRDYIAVGEIGIDLYWSKEFEEAQKEVFRQQVLWAKELGKPIVIHAREAFNEIFEIIDELNDERLTGIFHCFTGTLEQANHVIGYGGFKMGLGGVLTYKKSGLDKVIENVDLKHLVLETDSPYLPPTPYRGKRNESSYLLHIAEKLADVQSITLKQVAEATTQNAREIFNWE